MKAFKKRSMTAARVGEVTPSFSFFSASQRNAIALYSGLLGLDLAALLFSYRQPPAAARALDGPKKAFSGGRGPLWNRRCHSVLASLGNFACFGEVPLVSVEGRRSEMVKRLAGWLPHVTGLSRVDTKKNRASQTIFDPFASSFSLTTKLGSDESASFKRQIVSTRGQLRDWEHAEMSWHFHHL